MTINHIQTVFVFSLAFLTCCSPSINGQTNGKFAIDSSYTSTNYNSRIRQIIIHYTAGNDGVSLEELLGKDHARQVSSHYLITDGKDPKFSSIIYRIVPEGKRSWHAGISKWRYDDDLNNSSIGIEIVNKNGNTMAYTQNQIDAVIFLCQQMQKKYDIKNANIIGHSDIAPRRKVDPGTKFPWKTLYQHGVGAWYDDQDIAHYKNIIKKLPEEMTIHSQLHQYGYGISEETPRSEDDYEVIQAFQRHFRPEKIDGIMDMESYLILRALLKKYHDID